MFTTESRQLTPEVLERVYFKYRATVLRFLSLVEPDRSPAQGCLDVFEEVWHSASGSQLDGTGAEWVLGIAYRVVLRRAHSPDTPPGLVGRSHRIVSRLSWEQRVVVALVYASELSIDSIEEVTGMTRLEITRHLGAACELLRRHVCEPARQFNHLFTSGQEQEV